MKLHAIWVYDRFIFWLTATAIDITFRISVTFTFEFLIKNLKNVISVAYLQIGLDFTSKTSTVHSSTS